MSETKITFAAKEEQGSNKEEHKAWPKKGEGRRKQQKKIEWLKKQMKNGAEHQTPKGKRSTADE